MKKTTTILGIIAGLTMLISSCENYVQSVNPPIDTVDHALLNTESQIPFLLNGLTNRMGDSYAGLQLYGGLLSDELIAGQGLAPEATYPEYPLIDRGGPGLTTTEGVWSDVCSYRAHADIFIERCNKIKFSSDSLKKRCLFTGYLHGGIARQLMAMNFGLTERNGGGVLSGGEFITTAGLLDSAVDYFSKALSQTTSNSYEQRLARSFLARTFLLKGNMTLAESNAKEGFTEFDADFVIPYSTNAENPWFSTAGRGRTQIVLAPRFAEYIKQDSLEAGRVRIELGAKRIFKEFHILAKWPERGSPIPIMTWQEVSLIRAEAILVSRKDDVGALELLNRIRETTPVPGADLLRPLEAVTLDSIMVERDKQLLGTGLRLADQRRWNKWHWDSTSAANPWYFLPISQTERNTNKKLP